MSFPRAVCILKISASGYAFLNTFVLSYIKIFGKNYVIIDQNRHKYIKQLTFEVIEMIRMIRTVHPVGQGTFISEKFYGLNGLESIVIYDCGSQSGKSIVQREIRTSLNEGTKINAVFISHLDNDHINGLEFLMKYCRVENIFLPYQSNESLIMSLIKYKCDEESGIADYCSDYTLKLICGFLSNNMELRSDSESFSVFSFVNSGKCPTFYDIVHENIPIWKYLAFNNGNIKIKEKLEKLLTLNGIKEQCITDISSFFFIWDNIEYRNKLKKIYKELDGGMNYNSLGIISYPLKYAYKTILPFSASDICGNSVNTGAIYTGDMDLSDLKAEFYEYRKKVNSISFLQLPHHGSKYNYHSDCTKNIDKFIVTAGYSNSYGHPHCTVCEDIMIKEKCLLTVTENPGSLYRENININF